jgi:hypothetical protein
MAASGVGEVSVHEWEKRLFVGTSENHGYCTYEKLPLRHA